MNKDEIERERVRYRARLAAARARLSQMSSTTTDGNRYAKQNTDFVVEANLEITGCEAALQELDSMEAELN